MDSSIIFYSFIFWPPTSSSLILPTAKSKFCLSLPENYEGCITSPSIFTDDIVPSFSSTLLLFAIEVIVTNPLIVPTFVIPRMNSVTNYVSLTVTIALGVLICMGLDKAFVIFAN